jgi:hypothetical protein
MTYQAPISITSWSRDPTIAAIVRATFPDYRRKTVYVKASQTVGLHSLNWEGGSRSEYRACTITGELLGDTSRYAKLAPWDIRQVEGLEVPIPPGSVVVRGGHFCGKESLLTIHVNPADMPTYLPKP